MLRVAKATTPASLFCWSVTRTGGAFPLSDGAESIRFRRVGAGSFFACLPQSATYEPTASLQPGFSHRHPSGSQLGRDGKKEKGHESLDEQVVEASTARCGTGSRHRAGNVA